LVNSAGPRLLLAPAFASRHLGGRIFTPKHHLGEAPGAGALLQTVVAAMALEKLALRHALVTVVGWNQQASAACVERP